MAKTNGTSLSLFISLCFPGLASRPSPDTVSRMTNPASGSALEWVDQFEREKGRRLRVLHIGNIANNAYNNAKIQRQRGIEADVSSHDYFHVMACPEWEDAEFDGDVVDGLFPDWWNVDTNGFRRPAWFAQGNARTCQRYLG